MARRAVGAIAVLVAAAIGAWVLLQDDSDVGTDVGTDADAPPVVAAPSTPRDSDGARALPVLEDDGRPLRAAREPTTELEARVDDLVFGATAEDRLAAIEALAAWVPGDAEQALADASRTDPDPEVREAALETLLDASSERSLEAFRDAFTDADEWVRTAAENGLYDHDDTAGAQGVLAGFCRSDDEALRVRAAELLDEMTLEQLPWDEIAEGPTTLAWALPPEEDEAK